METVEYIGVADTHTRVLGLNADECTIHMLSRRKKTGPAENQCTVHGEETNKTVHTSVVRLCSNNQQ